MKLENPIGYCDVTANAVIGCCEVSTGCSRCFAKRDTPARVLRSKGIETWGPKGVRHPVAGFAEKVRRMNELCICEDCHATYDFHMLSHAPFCHCGAHKRRVRLFSDSNSDWLDDRWPIETLAAFLKAIHDAPNVIFQLLTKRPENFKQRIVVAAGQPSMAGTPAGIWADQWCAGTRTPINVWIGVSCENQEWADKRIPELLKIPAAVRFVSAEPLLEGINFTDGEYNYLTGCGSREVPGFGTQGVVGKKVDWVIVGGESGPNFRPCQVEWITDIADQCKAGGVPCWVKQDCGKKPRQQGRIPPEYWAIKQTPALDNSRRGK
ncbi:MAG TPA: DUF5131 family protein [Terracidiphilus sp.]|nr:DUF5131 family protein [Terracidiphilus sp.]